MGSRAIKHRKYTVLAPVLAQDVGGKNRKKASVGGAGQERGRRVKEEIKTINRRLVLPCPEATVGSLNFSLRAKQGTNGL